MTDSDIIDMYSKSQQGGELPYFIGKQTGSGWLRALGRFAIPILRRLGLGAVKVASGALAASATDALSGKKDFLPSLKQHTLSAVNENLPALKREAVNVIESIRKQPRVSKTINKDRNVAGTIFQK